MIALVRTIERAEDSSFSTSNLSDQLRHYVDESTGLCYFGVGQLMNCHCHLCFRLFAYSRCSKFAVVPFFVTVAARFVSASEYERRRASGFQHPVRIFFPLLYR